MNGLFLLLLVSFIESFSTTSVERGVYFFGTARLEFTEAINLWLALAFGLAYMAGAFLSHRLSQRYGEKRLLMATLWAQVLTHLALAVLWRRPDFIFTGNTVLGLINGLKWPVIESYISAGKIPQATAKAVGLFNIAWAAAVPLALLAAGPIIASSWPHLLFLVPAAINLTSLVLIQRLTPSPVHLPADHPERPSEAMILRLRRLLSGSRWLMACSYGTVFVLAAVLPLILTQRLAQSVKWAAGLSGLLDVVRLASFLVLQFYGGWHYRLRYVVGAMLALPLGFFMLLFAPNMGTLVAGEVIFGLAAGLIYYSALYYAMVVHSAAVEAGGTHEGLIGLGFAIGPLACLLGLTLRDSLHSQQLGLLVGIVPFFVVCFVAATRKLLQARKAQQEQNRAVRVSE